MKTTLKYLKTLRAFCWGWMLFLFAREIYRQYVDHETYYGAIVIAVVMAMMLLVINGFIIEIKQDIENKDHDLFF